MEQIVGGKVATTSDSGHQIFLLHPQMSVDAAMLSNHTQTEVKNFPFYLGGSFRVVTDISGSFAVGEGIDHEVIAQYLY